MRFLKFCASVAGIWLIVLAANKMGLCPTIHPEALIESLKNGDIWSSILSGSVLLFGGTLLLGGR